MDPITVLHLLAAQVAVGAAQKAGATIWERARAYWTNLTKGKSPELLRVGIEELSKVPARCADEIASKEFPQSDPGSRRNRVELSAFLLNLLRESRQLSSQQSAASYANRFEEITAAFSARLGDIKFRPGQVVPGAPDCQLIRFLGRGSFGEVWRGVNIHTSMTWAFKFFTQPNAEQWLKREYHALVQQNKTLGEDDRLVRLINVHAVGQKYPFMMLEYIDGGSLEDWIVETDKTKRLSLSKRQIMQDIVSAMARTHGRGVFHQDLKPANVLLTRTNPARAKLTDFGLAEVMVATRLGPKPAQDAVTSAVGDGQLTLMGVGTPLYHPPEASRPFAKPDPGKYDVFAIGVIWYQLLVEKLDRPPYDFVRHLRAHQVDTATIQTISRCMAAPEQRFNDAREVLAAMDEPPAPGTWQMPADGFDIEGIARGYLCGLAR